MSKQTTVITGEAGPSINARMSGEARRMEIVRVAMRLFSQRGFRGTTTKEIAQAAGVSEAIIFRHFATKEELYAAILDHKACVGGIEDPREIVADAIRRKDDRAVFEGLAFAALQHHEHDTDFNRLLLHAALEGHELAQMFWERTVLQIYEFLGAYISERQRDGAFREINPLIVVRAFIGMIIHHSLNNNLWDPQRRLLDITNEHAAHEFTEILLRGIKATQPMPRDEKSRKRAALPARSASRKKQ
ncbi:MAG TPA: helix-turn-helix domain-containing protein, partial [Pyrinomonadaceae bacterium]